MDKTLDPRLQLLPVDAKPRLMMFFLCVFLPFVIAATSLLVGGSDAGPDDTVGRLALTSAAMLAGLLALTLALWFVLDRAMLRHRLQLSSQRLEVKSSFYSQSLPLSDLKLDEARVIDLEERIEFRPRIKTNGYALPGFKSGYFRLKNGHKAFVAMAGERRVLWLPTTRGRDLLLQPRQPEALLLRLRELAAGSPRR